MNWSATLGWVLSNIQEIGLADRPDWIHVELALGNPIMGRIIGPVQISGSTILHPLMFECEDGVSVPGLRAGRIELFGLRLDLSKTTPRRSVWTFPIHDDEDIGDSVLVVEPWRRYATQNNCPFYPQIDWRPGSANEDACIRGGQFDKGSASDGAYKRARTMQLALLNLKDLKLNQGGQRTLEDKPDHPWRHFADQAIEMRKGDPFLSLPVLVERLGLLGENGEDRTKTLGRWINRRLTDLNEKNPS